MCLEKVGPELEDKEGETDGLIDSYYSCLAPKTAGFGRAGSGSVAYLKWQAQKNE